MVTTVTTLNPRSTKPHDFSSAEKMVIWVLVKLFELGYTPTPVFDKLQVVEHESHVDEGCTGEYLTFLASNEKGDGKVWIWVSNYGMGPTPFTVHQIIGWLPETRCSPENVFVLDAPPSFKHLPKTKEPEGGDRFIENLTIDNPEADGWSKIGTLRGSHQPPYARDHLRQIMEMPGAGDFFRRRLTSMQLGIHRATGTVWTKED